MNRMVLTAAILFWFSNVQARVLHIGNDQSYTNLQEAAAHAIPGDTLLFHAGQYAGEQSLTGLQGKPNAPIYILAETKGQVIISGGRFAWHFTDPAHLYIRGFVFERQTQNGVNIDDGGDYETPAHHLEIVQCTFRDMQASGNNDLLKLSGLDHFIIMECHFENGAAKGSGIDMVGCHDGTITRSHFENMGSNSIQLKGGSARILISRNYFKNGGLRTLNLGGSTGLPYFRPLNSTYEAADLKVFANIIIGSDAPVAFVGAVRVEVINNTIVQPGSWVIRILQETIDNERFLSCGDDTFANNLIYYGPIRTEVNIGGHTRPQSFTFSGNFWYRSDQPSLQPGLPVEDRLLRTGKDPRFENIKAENFRLKTDSPARKYIPDTGEPALDFFGNPFGEKRAAGAIAGG